MHRHDRWDMRDDAAPLRGIVVGLVIAVPIWAVLLRVALEWWAS